MTPALNKALPEFEALATHGVKFTPHAFAGRAVVLYFYPKDHTPGCTTEAMQFRDQHADFTKAGAWWRPSCSPPRPRQPERPPRGCPLPLQQGGNTAHGA